MANFDDQETYMAGLIQFIEDVDEARLEAS
jgi:hypothetical protein